MSYPIEKFIDEVLAEDVVDFKGKIPTGDHTSLACIPAGEDGRAHLICKEEGLIAGVELAELVFKRVNENLLFERMLEDGTPVQNKDVAFKVSGDMKAILRAERIVLNFMQRMSGIATHTSKFVERVAGTNCIILDTRKTTPNFRYFEKWAVRIGGGHNHRYGLYDMFMIKDNHIDFCDGIEKVITAVKNYRQKNNLDLKVEIEARKLKDVDEILRVGNVDRIMFDNFPPPLVKQAVHHVNKRFETEASGGITLQNVREYAETGVNFISVGALTHSSRSLDLSLKAF